jgi:hypothetical protein
MIAVEKFGSNFMGALSYNLKKLEHPDKEKKAVLLASSFSSLSPAIIRKEIDLIKNLRPALKKHVWHTSLNFSMDENPSNLTNENLLEIGFDYMSAMGYDDNQYLIVRHHDAEHPHIHLLVNRIRYDGGVVSDSNNFRRSQTVLRRLEQQYNLISLDQPNNRATLSNDQHNDITANRDTSITAELDNYRSGGQDNQVTKRALTKNEIEKTLRTGVPSDKSLLQAMLEPMIYGRRLALQEFIARCHRAGISLLFNQASTGRVSGITYFINDFKIKGQSLGNRFKWAEIIKYIDYEQDRDSKAISAANDGAKAKYGEAGERSTHKLHQTGGRTAVAFANNGTDAKERYDQRQVSTGNIRRSADDQATSFPIGRESVHSGEMAEQNKDSNERIDDNSYSDTDIHSYPGIEIADDVDDEAIHGRNRQRKARTNRR